MNFYKRFIGDIQAKTGNLSLAEFGAYDRLLDHYFSTEMALPLDVNDCYRICRAMDKNERKAVDKVLARFFSLSDCGYIQTKADEVIADALPKIEAARNNGKKGGRPKAITQQKPNGLSKDNPTETKDEPKAKASQSQTPSLRSGEARSTRLPADWQLPVEWADWCRTARPDLNPDVVAPKFADYWHAKSGKDATKRDWQATWRNWVRDERTAFKSGPAEVSEWHESRGGVQRKAAELGMPPYNEAYEQWPAFRARVMRQTKECEPPALTLDQLMSLAPKQKATV